MVRPRALAYGGITGEDCGEITGGLMGGSTGIYGKYMGGTMGAILKETGYIPIKQKKCLHILYFFVSIGKVQRDKGYKKINPLCPIFIRA